MHDPAKIDKPLIRVIDDDDAMRNSWAFLIEGEGWDVKTYADAIIEGIQGLMPNLGYEPAQSVVIQLKLEDNVYTMVGTDWQNLDGMIIDYSGQYAG